MGDLFVYRFWFTGCDFTIEIDFISDRSGNRNTPGQVNGDTDVARPNGVLPHDSAADIAADIAEVSEAGIRQTQGTVAMDECCRAVTHKLQRRRNLDEECRRRRISALTFIWNAETATSARSAGKTMRMDGACWTWITDDAGRNKCGLVHTINRY